MHACIHTCIHTYILSANSERSESSRPLDRTSFTLAHRHSAQWLASALSIGKLGETSLGMAYPLPQPLIFSKLYGEGAISPNLAQGHLALLPRYDTNTQPTRYDMCEGPGVPSSTPRGSKTLISSTLPRQHCLQPLGLAEPRGQIKTKKGGKGWKMARDTETLVNS